MTRYLRETADGVVVIARVRAKTGKRDELLKVLEDAVPPQAQFEADPALSLTFHTLPTDPDVLVFYKHYPTAASRDEHTANSQQHPVFHDLVARINALLAAPVEIAEEATPVVRYTRVDSLSQEELR